MGQVWAAYSPVKNSLADARAKVAAGNPSHSATAGELDIYQCNCRCGRLCLVGGLPAAECCGGWLKARSPFGQHGSFAKA